MAIRCLLLALIVGVAAFSQRASIPQLTVDWIMRGPNLYGFAPDILGWSARGERLYFRWKKHDERHDKEAGYYVVQRDGSGLRKLSEDEEKDAPPADGDESLDGERTVFADKGDLYLYDRSESRRRRLTATGDVESSPRFTLDQKRVAYTRGGNLYVLSPDDGSTTQMTDIRAFDAPKDKSEEKKGTESQEFLKKQELELLESVRERARRREEAEEKQKKENPRKVFRLARRQKVTDLLLAPDETFVAAMLEETAEDTKTAVVPNFVNESGYTADLQTRTKVGDVMPKRTLALVNVRSGESKVFDAGIKERAIVIGAPRWSDDGKQMALMARAADNKDAWILAVDPVAATARVLFQMHDDAWVLGGFVQSSWGFLPDGRIWFVSDRDGWSHVYTVPFEGGEAKQLTSGNWEVRRAQLDPAKTRFLLTTSEAHPGEDQVYELALNGGARRRLTQEVGGHADATLSPDGFTLATISSSANRPPELYLRDLRNPAAKAVRVTESPAPEFSTYPWTEPPLVEIPARDGAKVPARMYKPSNWKPGGPLVVFVHGAGYLQNAHRRWSNYAREYLFHHLLRDRGFLVLDIDYRGSAGYGRDWRTAIYRHMGGKDLDDHVDAVKWAVSQHRADPKRVGLYGGSYGGFITLMALFTQPDVFAAGAALRPVTDWAHYNHPYTSNILNVAPKDEEAYRRSSPIYHAQGLKGALLICHGMVDVNVHFQDTVRLVQRLIELRKENWELAVYPVEDHGFTEPSSWADEYKRILKLFEGTLRSQGVTAKTGADKRGSGSRTRR